MKFRKEEFVRVGRTWGPSTPTNRPGPPSSSSSVRTPVVRPSWRAAPGPLVLGRRPSHDPATTLRGLPDLLPEPLSRPSRPRLPDLDQGTWKRTSTPSRGSRSTTSKLYVLNRFVAEHLLHQDIYGIVRKLLGRRLCPFVVPEDPTVELALTKGASLLDVFPETPAASSMVEVSRWTGPSWNERRDDVPAIISCHHGSSGYRVGPVAFFVSTFRQRRDNLQGD